MRTELRIISFAKDPEGEFDGYALAEIVQGTHARLMWRMLWRKLRIEHHGGTYRFIRERIPGGRFAGELNEFPLTLP